MHVCMYVCPFEKQYNKLESCLLPAYKTPQSVKKKLGIIRYILYITSIYCIKTL